MRLSTVQLAVMFALAGSGFLHAQDAVQRAAQRTLRTVGLSQSGRFWILAEEQELQRQLDQLPREEKSYFAALQQFRTMQGQYQAVRAGMQRNRTKLGEILDLLGKSSTGGLQRQNLEGESQRLAEQVGQAEKVMSGQLNVLDESSDMTQATVDLVNAQNMLAIMLLDIRRHTNSLPQAYKQLSSDGDVQSALSAQTESKELGPVENYAAAKRKLQRLESLIFTDGVPFYRRSKQIRISGILNERQPITFSYTGPSGPTLLPAGALLGMNVDLSTAPQGSKVSLENQEITTRRVFLPSLRIGKHVWHQVPVDVLPPEAEYLGARISMQAFGGMEAKIEENNLWFRIRQREP